MLVRFIICVRLFIYHTKTSPAPSINLAGAKEVSGSSSENGFGVYKKCLAFCLLNRVINIIIVYTYIIVGCGNRANYLHFCTISHVRHIPFPNDIHPYFRSKLGELWGGEAGWEDC